MHSADIRMGDQSLKSLRMALLGATFLVGAAGAATAADIYNKGGSYKDAPGEYMPAITWTGFYVGINGGAAFTDEDTTDNDDTVFVGGFHAGYNWQKHGPWVFGIEGDVNFADDVDYVASIRGRLGYAMGSSLLYGTGGAAFLGASDGDDDDDALEGWVAGLGLEHKFTPDVSAGLETLYYNYGEVDGSNEDLDTWTVRARLTYHLGGGGYGGDLK
jgi:outer membrane immunogenic protein